MTDHVREALTRAALRCPDDGELAEALALYDAREEQVRDFLLDRIKANRDERDTDPETRARYYAFSAALARFEAIVRDPAPGGAGVKVYVMRRVEDGRIDWATARPTVEQARVYWHTCNGRNGWEIVRVEATVTPVEEA